MFVELHILQNFPPSNLNRDDVGQPKDGDFGGFRRARISSQCLKRSIRYAGKGKNLNDPASQSVFERYTKVPLSIRTKLLANELANQLVSADSSKSHETALAVAKLFAVAYSGKMDQKRKDETAVLLYLSEQEVERVTERLSNNWEEALKLLTIADAKAAAPDKTTDDKVSKGKKGKGDKPESSIISELAAELVKETENRTGAPDIALFGRMLADNPDTNIDAACQVAHAISTHFVPKAEIDYYTAMDDLKQRANDLGAGFLDVAYFNSACFYRYARVDVKELTRNLGNDVDAKQHAINAIEAFLRASEAAIPSGKKNSHAQECRPSFMLAVVRNDQSEGWSLVNAFEKPVRPSNESGLVEESVAALCDEFEDHCERYGAKSVAAKSIFVSRRVAQAVNGTLVKAIAKAQYDEDDNSIMVKSALDVLVETVTKSLQGA